MKLVREMTMETTEGTGKIEVFGSKKNSKLIVLSPVGKSAFSARREDHFLTAQKALGIWFAGNHRWIFDFRFDATEMVGQFKIDFWRRSIFEYEKINGEFQFDEALDRKSFWESYRLTDPGAKGLAKLQEKYTKDEKSFKLLTQVSQQDFNQNQHLLNEWKSQETSWAGGSCDAPIFVKQTSPKVRFFKVSGIRALLRMIESRVRSIQSQDELRFALLPDFIGDYEEVN
ncbi:MAG: hypothetical protein V4507_15675 [Verrucomicrobiota bacterium]